MPALADQPTILHLITRWLKGGAEAKTLAELEGLSDSYGFVLAHGAEREPDAAAHVDALDVPRYVVPALRHYAPHTVWPAIGQVRMILDEVDPDILHVHSTEAGAIGRWAAKRYEDLPVVYTLHGMPFGPNRAAPLRWFVKSVEKHLAKHTTVYAANAQAIVDSYLEAGIGTPDQYEVIYSGVDLEALEAAEPADGLPGQQGSRILFAGRLEQGKGIRRLVRAVDRLREGSGPAEASLLVAGTGPLQDELEGLDHSWLHVLGFRDDLPSIMKGCDVLSLPSDHEGTPRVITEAMACGLPVVASDVGGIPEQVADGQSGLLVPARDGEALVDALQALLEDPDRRRSMAKVGRDRVERFSVEAMVEATDALYQRLLG